jgi:hypothetical protein
MLDALQKAGHDQLAAHEVTQIPATDAEISNLIIAMKSDFDATLPQGYLRFLKMQNGLDYNGLVLYGSHQTPDNPSAGGFWQGVVIANKLWRENQSLPYIILGETELDIFTVSLDGQMPMRRDRVSGDSIESYTSVESMIEAILLERL